MNTTQFETKMKGYELRFNTLMDEIKNDVIQYSDANPQKTTYDLNVTTHFVDNICESGAWVIDRINNDLGSKKGLKYKIRKALGFTHP